MKQIARAPLDWVRYAAPMEGMTRIEAWFSGKAYAMHRHDTYAIGRTLARPAPATAFATAWCISNWRCSRMY